MLGNTVSPHHKAHPASATRFLPTLRASHTVPIHCTNLQFAERKAKLQRSASRQQTAVGSHSPMAATHLHFWGGIPT